MDATDKVVCGWVNTCTNTVQQGWCESEISEWDAVSRVGPAAWSQHDLHECSRQQKYNWVSTIVVWKDKVGEEG